MEIGYKDYLYRECSSSSIAGGTDVYFIGTPTTGKSCVVSGLLKAIKQTRSVHMKVNPYAFGMLDLLDDGFLPYPTVLNTALAIGVDVNKGKRKRSFNIIEADGESAMRIADSDVVSFKEMNIALASMLANGNPKILFLVIDPCNHNNNIRQEDVLCALLDLLAQNADIKKNVQAIHIVVSKYDMVGPDTSAEKIVAERYAAVLSKVKDLGFHHSLQIIPFSLGHFHDSETVDYNPKDSQKLLDMIIESISVSRIQHLINKVRGWLRSCGNRC